MFKIYLVYALLMSSLAMTSMIFRWGGTSGGTSIKKENIRDRKSFRNFYFFYMRTGGK